MNDVRALAATAIAAVSRDGQAFEGETDAALAPRDQSLFRELCYGTLRHFYYLQALLAPRLKKPLGKRDADIEALLLLGIYQLLFMRTPDHAALNATVGASKALSKAWARGLINAVLRNILRDWDGQGRQALPAPAGCSEAARASMPDWLYARLQGDWPQHWQQLIEHANARAPMTLRVDLRRQSRDAYNTALQDQGLEAFASTLVDSALTLQQACDVSQLPGFGTAQASVQDAGAQLAAAMLDPQNGQRVLDACAAPGGKTLHLLQWAEALELTAIDHSAARLLRLRENIDRAGAGDAVRLIEADAARVDHWWDGVPFDRILLDAPCSGSGVINRHPDIKLLRRETDIAGFARLQLQMLEALWPVLAEDGVMLYCSCSVMREENEAVLLQFLQREPTASELPLPAEWGEACAAGRQLLPKKGINDGFFYARLRKSGA